MPDPNPLALPPTLSPDALDAQTELATILTRLRTAIQSQASSSASVGGITGATPLPTTGATPNPLGATPGSGTEGGGGASGTVSLREVSAQTDALKHKVQRARTQVKALPDMERDISEQEEEMRELEETIRVQREVLQKLRERGVQFGTEAEKMETE